MRVLVLGVTGMLGSAVYRLLSEDANFHVMGTARSAHALDVFPEKARGLVLTGVDVLSEDALVEAFARTRPEVIINCVGVIKQLAAANDPLAALPLNSLFPHRLARMAGLCAARVVHISTDCVFSGRKGGYTEADVSDAEDLYGKSKFLGELADYPNAVTLRTSIIGHELGTNHALLEWFLSQSGGVKGYRKAVFSGLPTSELARVIRDHVIPRKDLHGLYHVSVDPIDKYSLLTLVSEVYRKQIEITPDDRLSIDRSLNSDRFRKETGYQPPGWRELIQGMSESRLARQ